ncbi:hypothetical protein [Maribacter aquivivus]|uniref:hypothetical protein n=1 Tax=Maribacter aquivivus TaxID=228958 RepID=UPI00249075AF|nr:hypothetical protein [Maribacter aquivivus]
MRLYIQLVLLLALATSQAQNSEDNINYSSFITDENVHVQLSTFDQATMLTMLHKGFYVYFDVKGKRKKNVAIQYPINIAPPEKQNRNERNNGTREELEEEQRGPDIATLLAEMPKIGEYTNLDYEQEFHLDLNQLGVSITYVYNEENKELQYELIIPKYKISDANLSKLSIGIVTPKREKESKDKDSNISFGSGGQGGGGGGRGGQGGPGGGQGGGGRGGSQGGPSPQNDRPEETTIDIWFKADKG